MNYNIKNLEWEIWKDIPNYYELYQGSNLNRIKSLERWITTKLGFKRFIKEKILHEWVVGSGYRQIGLFKNNKLKFFYVHRILAQIFLPNPLNLPEVNHKNGIKTDNKIENLEWVSKSENMQHAHKIGLIVREPGEKNYNKKLNNEQVLEIRKMYATGNYSQRKLGEIFKVDRGNIHYITSRKTWSNI